MGYTYNWTIYGKRNVKDLNSYMPTYKQQNIAKPTSTYTPTEYSDSRGTYAKDISAAKAALNNTISNKPGEYQSQYTGRLNSIADQMGNRKFSYDVNSDALFQQLKTLYNEQGKQAMADTQGQAAALTGGYGNSYGAAASQQAYQKSMEQLYDRIPELQQMAFQQYQQENADLQNLYAMLSDRDTTDYGRYRDTVSDWENERAYRDQAVNNLRSMNQNIWGQNETNKYNANKQAWDNYQWGEDYDLSARNAALELARSLRNDDVSYNQWADEMTMKDRDSNRSAAQSDYWNSEDLNYNYARLNQDQAQYDRSQTETERHNKVNEENDSYSNQTTREHYEQSDGTDTNNKTLPDGSKPLGPEGNSRTSAIVKKISRGELTVSQLNSYLQPLYDSNQLSYREVYWLKEKYGI